MNRFATSIAKGAQSRSPKVAAAALCLSTLVVACSTTPPQAPSPPTLAAPQVQQEPAPDLTAECPPARIICPTVPNNVMCAAASYGRKNLAVEEQVVAWAGNECQGRVALAQEACRLRLAPSRLGQIECVPDASGGHCPPPPVICSADFNPSICEASTYSREKLPTPEPLRAKGNNACQARAALRKAACRRNLDPDLLGEVKCGPDQPPRPAGSCPDEDDSCRDNP